MHLQIRLTSSDLEPIQSFLTSSHKIGDPRLSEDIAKEIINSEQGGYDISKVRSLSELDLSKIGTQTERIRIIVADNGAYIVATKADNPDSLKEKRQLAEDHLIRISQLDSFVNSPEARAIAEKFIKKADSIEQIKEGLMLNDIQLLASEQKLASRDDVYKWADLPSLQRHMETPGLSRMYYGKNLLKLLKEVTKKKPVDVSMALLKMPLGCLWS